MIISFSTVSLLSPESAEEIIYISLLLNGSFILIDSFLIPFITDLKIILSVLNTEKISLSFSSPTDSTSFSPWTSLLRTSKWTPISDFIFSPRFLLSLILKVLKIILILVFYFLSGKQILNVIFIHIPLEMSTFVTLPAIVLLSK